MQQKIRTLETFLENHEISEFSESWIDRSNEKDMSLVYKILKTIGLGDDKIANRAELLGRDPETIERNYQRLSKLGLKDDKIATNAQLLGMNPETIERNYQHHVGLLRQNYEDRDSGRKLLTTHAQLLGINPKTIEANVQYLTAIGIDYNNGLLLGTTTKLKRKKMAWLLREIFDYREVLENKKQDTIQRMREFVRENPRYLINSISTLEKAKDKIKEKSLNYN